jgi:FkbM family methyltransferase
MRSDLVYDIGAHRGEDSDYYLKRGFHVICVECDPAHVSFLKTRFEREIGDGRLTLIDRALASEEGTIKFYRNKTVSVWGTTQKAWAERNVAVGTTIEEIFVEAITPAQLFSQYGIPFYLKIDIEGADVCVLHELCQFSEKPSYLSFESEAVSFDRLLAEFKLLRSLGYDCFKLSPQHQVHLQKIPNSSVHGAQIDYAFEKGSSGAFGEDLEGVWLSEKDAVAFYKAIFVQYDLERALKAGVLQGSYKQFLAAYGHHGAWDAWYDTHARHASVPHRPRSLANVAVS